MKGKLARVAATPVEPSPSPSPINVNLTVSMPPINVPPDATLDNYTHALANSTEALAIFTLLVAVVGAIAPWFQRREIKATEQQLRLARDEFEAAPSADRAKLQVDAGFAHPTEIMGGVKYVSGRQPAYDIEVWGRTWAGYSGARSPPF